jgi:hypothetical protein
MPSSRTSAPFVGLIDGQIRTSTSTRGHFLCDWNRSLLSAFALSTSATIDSSRLVPVNRSAERGQRIQISRRVVTDEMSRPCTEQDERRSHGDDGSTHHGGAPVILFHSEKKFLRNSYWLEVSWIALSWTE